MASRAKKRIAKSMNGWILIDNCDALSGLVAQRAQTTAGNGSATRPRSLPALRFCVARVAER